MKPRRRVPPRRGPARVHSLLPAGRFEGETTARKAGGGGPAPGSEVNAVSGDSCRKISPCPAGGRPGQTGGPSEKGAAGVNIDRLPVRRGCGTGKEINNP